MKNLLILIIISFYSILINAQQSQRIMAESTDGIAIEGKSIDSIGVLGISESGPGIRGVGLNSFSNGVEGAGFTYGVVGECTWDLGSGVHGESVLGKGVSGISTDDIGIYGKSTNSHGVWAQSINEYGLYAQSVNGAGALINGGNGVSIELVGNTSPYTAGDDDAVIKLTSSQPHGDLILSSNDIIEFWLDDDNNSAAEYFSVYNGLSNEIFELDASGNLTIAGTYNPSSDRNRKESISLINQEEILSKVSTLPISEWQFIGEDVRHMGPMAQDFYATFGLGKGETTIATVDADGVALAAIQALKKENDDLKDLVKELIQRVEKLEAR